MEAKIIGVRGAGKSTLLEALAAGRATSGLTSVKVVDDRVRRLSAHYNPKKTTFAEFRTADVDWPRGDGRRGAMEQYLNALQGANVFLHVVRAFDNPTLGEPVRPAADLDELDSAFLLSDLEAIERVQERARKQPLDANTVRVLEVCKAALADEIPLRELSLVEADAQHIRGFGFRSRVPQVVVVNTESGARFDPASLGPGRRERAVVAFPFTDAREVAELSPEDQLAFAEALGLPGPAVEVVTQAVFTQMGLLSFFTVGEDEVRAWPVPRGATARQAAGVIHSDLERGFIRAETVAYADFIEHGSMKACRDKGLVRLEGKDYEVRDGDILNIRFNV